MRLKVGVKIGNGVHSAILVAMSVCDSVYKSLPYGEGVITAFRNGSHKTGSLHFASPLCRAMDVRTRNIYEGAGMKETLRVRDIIAATLGPDFDVIYEDPGGDNQHFHIEYDPKGHGDELGQDLGDPGQPSTPDKGVDRV